MKKILVIGCGGAGMFSAIVATQIKPKKFDATILSDEKDIYCRCTTPYILTGEASLKEAVQPDSMITDFGVKLVPEKAIEIDIKKKRVKTNKNNWFSYDKLVISTGASPFIPNIEGSEKAITVRTSDDVRNINKHIQKAKTATIIGAGVIGIEMAGALREHGLEVTIIEFANRPLAGIASEEYSKNIYNHLKKNHITSYFNSEAKIITDNDVTFDFKGKLKTIKSDIVILAAGVRANTDIIKGTGIKTNKFGIIVNKKMMTNKCGVYACGDVAVPINAITGENTPSQLASSAIQQAKIVGYQLAGYPIKFSGSTGAFAFKTMGKEYAGAGLTEERAREKYKFVIVGNAKTTNIYRDMRIKEDLELKLIFAGLTMRLVGVEAYGVGVTGHVEVASLAMNLKANILKLLKYNYIAHPSLTPWPFMNPIIMATEDAVGKIMKKLKLA